jgi:DHA2 family multidrug resistance protein
MAAASTTAPAAPQANPWIIAFSVMFATFMEVLDTTVVNVSVPYIAGSLSATNTEATWTLTSYLVANAVILPITGWLANYFGRKRLLMSAVTGFTAASFLCGLAPTLTMLILLRVVQGACGGVLQPISQAILLEAFPPEDRGKAMGFWGLGIVVAPALGPVVGGWLTFTYSWRWVFYINIPVGIVSIIMTKMFIFDPPYIRRPAAGIDYWGIGFLALGISALQVVLDKGQEKDWFGTRWIAELSIVSAAALVIFLLYELRVRNPVVNLRVFKNRTYAIGVALMTILGFELYGALVVFPLLLQTLLGYTSYIAGRTMFPRGLGSLIAMPMVGALVSRFDPRKVLAMGFLGLSCSLMQLSWLNLNAGFWDFFWPQLIQGFAIGTCFVPLTTITMDPIPREQMGNATSLFNLVRNIGGSAGISIAQTLNERNTQRYINIWGANITPYSDKARSMLNGLQSLFVSKGFDPATALHKAQGVMFNLLQQQASILSYLHTFRLLGVFALATIPLVLLLRKPAGGKSAVAMH